ncbi:hypothetical protein NYE69_27175 [Paenibacillus sp. FSL R5-0527]|uniref:hypothetical protein n=1 Tax=Paenibacillus sp. FSL R5-0527 TaxID=2975321 RepID=UPI00097A0FC7|nr:hypothetical protein BK140_33370 [Paenibacillus macerans]
MDDQTWFKYIKPFEWEELDGKTLKIRAGKQEGVLIVVGYDQETKDIFVLHDGKAADPIPLPTIKPEDWVYHTKFKAKGQVKRISESGKRAYVIWINGAAPSFVDLKSLEVVSHD